MALRSKPNLGLLMQLFEEVPVSKKGRLEMNANIPTIQLPLVNIEK